MKTVMACVDFSPVTDEVVQRALDLARASDSKVCLVHVVAPVPVVGPPEVLTSTMTIVSDERLKLARRRLESLREQLRCNGTEIKTLLFEGLPADSILSAAANEDADLIVIGSHGLGFLRRVFLGSTTMGVLKAARCPVVVVPSQEVVERVGKSFAKDEIGF